MYSIVVPSACFRHHKCDPFIALHKIVSWMTTLQPQYHSMIFFLLIPSLFFKGFFLTLATFSLKEKYVLCGYKNVFEFLKALTEDIKKKKKKSSHNFVLSMH